MIRLSEKGVFIIFLSLICTFIFKVIFKPNKYRYIPYVSNNENEDNFYSANVLQLKELSYVQLHLLTNKDS